MSQIVSNLMKRYASNLQIIDTGTRIEFKFPFNNDIRLGLKAFGAKWDGASKVWYMGKRMKKLPEAIAFFEGFQDQVSKAELEKFQKQTELYEALRKGFPVRNLPYIHRNLAKDLGGLWDSGSKFWVMPTIELRDEVENLSRSLYLRTPFEYSHHARDNGGKWDKDYLAWVMPTKASYDKAVAGIEAEKAKNLANQPKGNVEKERAERAAKDQGFDPGTVTRFKQSLESVRPPDPKRGDFRVGQQWDHKGTLMQVVYVEDVKQVEDGWSFGFTFDDGWTWGIWAVPVPASDTDSHEKERERLSKAKAERILLNLEKVFQQTGRVITTPTRINGEILCARNDRGQEKLFVIDGNTSWLLTRRPFMDGDMFYDRPITHPRLRGEYDGVAVRSNPKFEQLLREIQTTLGFRPVH